MDQQYRQFFANTRLGIDSWINSSDDFKSSDDYFEVDLGGGIFGMYAGDADANGTVELDDKTLFWSLEAGSSGYLNSDFNMDSQTE